MIIKCALKWTALLILMALGAWLFVAYWLSTNDYNPTAAAPTTSMKAIRYCEYGSPDVVKLDEVEKPVADDNQVLIKVRAASLNALDAYMIRDAWLKRLIFGLRKPRDTRLGRDVAGGARRVGKKATHINPRAQKFCVSRRAHAPNTRAFKTAL